ncbi:MAG: hypothetical protein M1828_004505 [Chrysothrix sp. TS-e1954]|nr:MAG: hypothetical protein M1828_004505 [Chrysothrix sp. TS-e1954]
MSIPNEALQKLLQEIEQKAAVSQQQITIVRAQIAGKQREKRIVKLTTDELSSLPKDNNVYEGVGRMQDIPRHPWFVMSKTQDVKDKNASQDKELDTEIVNLNKRLHYLETTAKNSQEHINQMLKSGR